MAIALVVSWHYLFARIGIHSLFWRLLQVSGRLSWTGVDLFFVLSGFLIGGILLDSRDSPNYFRTFYIRRFFRIVPLYFVLIGA
ncbi:MAG: acyltransferase family protein, partial [Candidatus Acidiferrales bacterium]